MQKILLYGNKIRHKSQSNSRNDAVGDGNENRAADDIAERHDGEVVEKSADGDGRAARRQQPKRERRHVRDAVLKSAAEKAEYAPKCHDELRDVVLRAKAAPHGEADEHVAEDAAQKQREKRDAHLRGGSAGDSRSCRARARERQPIYE